MNRVAVLGSTGSIGVQTLSVARHLPDDIEIVALAGGWNAAALSRQIAEFRPRLYYSLCPELVPPGDATFVDMESIASDSSVDTVVVATSGRAGLMPTLAALRCGKRVALASKEVLAIGGKFVMEAARSYDAQLVPVDSEHSAIWQCLRGESSGIQRLILTASGGPFLERDAESLELITAADALAHPVWSMGSKITVDSATMMNKGLEVIEAHWLFDVPLDRIEVVVHPECVVHSMVEFTDGSVKAQLGVPDMALPIQYALTYPSRLPGAAQRLDWDVARTLTFQPVDEVKFRCLQLARKAALAGGDCPAVLCGADEAAVDLFLQGRIRFTAIADLVEGAMSWWHYSGTRTLDDAVTMYESGRKYVYHHVDATGVHEVC